MWAVQSCGEVLGIGDSDEEDAARQERIDERQADQAQERRQEAARAARLREARLQRRRRVRAQIRERRQRQRQQAIAEQPAEPEAPAAAASCESGYSPCVPLYPPDIDCDSVTGPIAVTGSDPHGLDLEGDGIACEP